MTKPLHVDLAKRSYKIHFSDDDFSILKNDLKKFCSDKTLFIVTDNKIAKLYKKQWHKNLTKDFVCHWITIPSGEQHKTLATIEKICLDLSKKGAHRKSLLVALGGGVVGDITGLAASLYMRGIPFVQIPTTLLAQVDSSVGGKTAVDLPSGKNLVGHFYQPKAVYIFTSFLKTLSERDYRSGLAEVIKYGLIYDAAFFKALIKNKTKLQNREPKTLTSIIRRCCEIKSLIVAADETEQDQRAILNFGHTFGHAYEALENYTGLTHGEAVSLGMVFSTWYSQKIIPKTLLPLQELIDLLKFLKLPTKSKAYPLSKIKKALASDKKSTGQQVKFITLNQLGCAKIKPVSLIELTSRWQEFLND